MKQTEAQKAKVIKKRLDFQRRCGHFEIEETGAGSRIFRCENCGKKMTEGEWFTNHG